MESALDAKERQLAAIRAKIRNAPNPPKVWYIAEAQIRNEYEALKDNDELCYIFPCRQHTGPDHIHCENHRRPGGRND